MTDHSENNKRIAKNTLLLYFRLIITIIVGLYTSRVVLNTLGIEDYGVYNVVAGVVTLFSLVTNALSVAISRFLTFELGRGDKSKLEKIFSTSVSIQALMAVALIIVLEVLGMWLLNNQLNIPLARLYAAKWVLHCSIFTLAINLISVPYTSSIISHENLNVYAYISILEVSLKLVVVYALLISPYDKLIVYAVLYVFVAIIIRLVYGFYCSRKYEECHYRFIFDKNLYKEMMSFAGWSFLGNGVYAFNTQGVNILSNIFFGVTVNAARGISTQVEAILKQFVTNFTTALNPQITKSYATGDMNYMYSLICRSSKFSYLLMLIFAVPFIFEADFILAIWLKEYPLYSPLFLRLAMVGTMFDLLGNSASIATGATGNIKNYYIVVSSIGALVFPLSWLAFLVGLSAYWSYIVFILIYIVLLFVRLSIIRKLIDFPVTLFNKTVILKILPCTLVSFILPLLFYCILEKSIISSFIIILICGLSTLVSIYCIGLTEGERTKCMEFVKQKIARKQHI